MPKYIYISLMLVAARSMRAQYRRQQFHNYYVTVSPYAEDLFYKEPSGTLTASFPYTCVNLSTGVLSHPVYTSSAGNLFTNGHYSAGVDIEIGSKFYGEIKVGAGYRDNDEASLGVGYNLSFYDKMRHPYKSYYGHNSERNFLLKFSLSVAENQFNQYLDCIDNDGKNLFLLSTAAPYTTTSHSSRSSKTYTYNAKQVNVEYNQTMYSVIPQVSFSNNPFKSWFYFKVSAAWQLPFAQKGGLLFDQRYKGGGGKDPQNTGIFYPTYYNAQTPNLSLQYNGNPITKTPFSFGGPMVQLSIGINIGHFFK